MNNPPPDSLLLAALYADSTTINKLLRKGHNPNINDELGITPIGWIIAYYNTLPPPREKHKVTPQLTTCAKLLINAGARLDLPDIHGRTPASEAKKCNFNIILDNCETK